MYEELAKRLRYCAISDNQCSECKYHGGSPDGSKMCLDVLMEDAADAIEELTGFVQEAERDRDEYRERLERTNELLLNRWIPVTERLPEDRSDVLAYLKYEVGGRIAAANYDKGMWQDCVMGGLYRTEEGVVTHWMPIPQPPKEET